MKFDMNISPDAIIDKAKEVSETTSEKVSELNEKYISKATAELGKYGDVKTFAEIAIPGVQEAEAIKEGDWGAVARAAVLDVTGGVGGRALNKVISTMEKTDTEVPSNLHNVIKETKSLVDGLDDIGGTDSIDPADLPKGLIIGDHS